MASYDWKLTEDGDLDVGTLETDEDGNQYYIGLDREMTTEWEEESKEVRDIGFVFDIDTEAQLIKNRLKTENPDWYHHMGIGANLSDLIGLPNTRETAQLGIENITISLMYKGLYNRSQINVQATPISFTQILFTIEIEKFNNRIVQLPVVFDLETGVSNAYEVPDEEDILYDEHDEYDEIDDPEIETGVESDTPLNEIDGEPDEFNETDDEKGSEG